jgi:hypothetical protein
MAVLPGTVPSTAKAAIWLSPLHGPGRADGCTLHEPASRDHRGGQPASGRAAVISPLLYDLYDCTIGSVPVRQILGHPKNRDIPPLEQVRDLARKESPRQSASNSRSRLHGYALI